MLGIIIGVSAVILLVSIGQGLQSYITQQFESLGSDLIVVLPGKVGGGGISSAPNLAGSKLTLTDVDRLSRLGGAIESVGAGIEMPSTVSYLGKSKYTTTAGLTAEYQKMRNLTVSDGRMISDSDNRSNRNVVDVGPGIVDALFNGANPIGKQVTMGGQKFQVVGILSKIASGGFGVDINSFVVLPLTSAQQLFGMKSVQAIGVKAIDKDSIPQAIAQVNKELGKYHKSDDFSVVDSSSLVATINQILGVVTLALGGIAAISLVVGGVGIMNIMLVSVTERTREIGLRKAVGAKPQDILIQFLIESVALSVTGGGIGVLIGYLGSLAINQFINTTVTFWSVALAFGVSAAIGIIFGVAPAARASKLNPIEALKYE
ncbi:MAG TPA: ABC transporter permease [Candidatus Saccharimonadales bacterium]|jgi:putative ABC transport system permease protein|nr:ABC transporter permease [Candidatus Saccharimonadales bacterium]